MIGFEEEWDTEGPSGHDMEAVEIRYFNARGMQ